MHFVSRQQGELYYAAFCLLKYVSCLDWIITDFLMLFAGLHADSLSTVLLLCW